MLSGLGGHQKKFNLLYLEEGEHYIQDFFGKVRYFDVHTNSYRVEEAVVHFCSRSLIIDLSKSQNKPMYKYLLKYFLKEPTHLGKASVLPMMVQCSRVIEVPINSVTPKPYVVHTAKQVSGLELEYFEIAVNIDFYELTEFFNALRDLFFLYKQKGHSYE